MADQTYSLKILADVAAFQAGMMLIPGVTEKQAAKAATALASQMAKGSDKAIKDVAKNVTAVVKEVEQGIKKATKGVEDSFGAVGGAAAKVTGGLNLLSGGSGAVTQAINDIADGGEVAAEVLAMVGVTGGAAGVAIAALAVTLGTVIGVWRAYNEEGVIAAQIAENVKVAEAARQPILDELALKTIDLKVATGELTEAEGVVAAATERGAQRQVDALDTVQKKIGELLESQHGWSAAIGDFAENLPIADYNLISIAVDGWTTSSSELTTQIKAENVEKQKTIDANKELTQTGIDAALAKQQEKEASEDIARAEKEAAKRKADNEKAAAKAKATSEAAAAANLKNAEAVYSAIESLKRMTAESNLAAEGQKSDSELISLAYHKRLADIEDVRVAGIAAAHDYDTVNSVNAASDEAASAAYEAQKQKQNELAEESAATRVKADEAAYEQIVALQEKQDAIFQKGHDDAIALIEEEKAARMAAIAAAADVINQLDSLMSQLADRQNETLSETSAALDDITGLLDALNTDTVNAAALQGDALVNAYKSGQVAAEDLTDAQRAFLEQNLLDEQAALQKKEDGQKASAMATWQVQKQLSAAAAVMEAIEATVAGLAKGGPVLAAVYAGIGAASVALIETAKPPSFRSGYYGGPSMGASMGGMPDQQVALIEPNSEVVMGSQGVQAAGGLQAAKQQAAGIPPAINTTTVVHFGHKLFNEVTTSSLRRPGALHDASVRPRGRGNPYNRVR